MVRELSVNGGELRCCFGAAASEWRRRRRRNDEMGRWETRADTGACVGVRQTDVASTVRRPAMRGLHAAVTL